MLVQEEQEMRELGVRPTHVSRPTETNNTRQVPRHALDVQPADLDGNFRSAGDRARQG